MALKIVGVVDSGMYAQEALGGSSWLEPLHLVLLPSHRLMRVLRPVVSPEALFVRAGQPEMPKRRAVGAQLVGYQQLRRKSLLLSSLRISLRAAWVSRRR
jgi:hypothetical protein